MMAIEFLAVGVIVGLVIGYAVATLRERQQVGAVSVELAALKAKAETWQASREELEKAFKVVAGDALRNNNQSFLELATQNLGRFQLAAKDELEKRKRRSRIW